MTNTYPALAYEFKDRPGVYIDHEMFETENVNHAFLYVNKDGSKPNIQEIIEIAKEQEELHRKNLEKNFKKVEVINYKPYTWLEHCNLVEVEISEDTFNLMMENEK